MKEYLPALSPLLWKYRYSVHKNEGIFVSTITIVVKYGAAFILIHNVTYWSWKRRGNGAIGVERGAATSTAENSRDLNQVSAVTSPLDGAHVTKPVAGKSRIKFNSHQRDEPNRKINITSQLQGLSDHNIQFPSLQYDLLGSSSTTDLFPPMLL